MRRGSLGAAAAALAVGLAVSSLGGAEGTAEPRVSTVFGRLAPGQVVTLKEAPGGVEITSLPDLPVGYRVIEVARDFVVLEAPGGAFEQRIPATAIRSVTFMRRILPG